MGMRNLLRVSLALAAAVAGAATAPAHADRFCNPGDTRIPCSLPDGDYHIRAPEGAGPFPAVVVLHSAGETGADIVNDPFYVALILGRGFALVAPTGRPQPYAGGVTANGWHVRQTSTGGRDDAAFIASVIDVAAQRFQLDRKRTMVIGYGNGATLVWELACLSPAIASAYVPMDGGFYEKLPARCHAPVRMMVMHSRRDGFWPLDESEVSPARGTARPVPITDHLALMARVNGCGSAEAVEGKMPGDTRFTQWRGCYTGAELAFLEQRGGASLSADVFSAILDWFEPPATPSRIAPPGVGSVFRRPGEGGTTFGKRPPTQ